MLGIARAVSNKEYRLINESQYNSSGAFTVPAGTQYLEIEMWGGGGGGGRGHLSSGRSGTAYQGGEGGGGGAYVKHKFVTTNLQSGDTLNFTIGAGGDGTNLGGGTNKGDNGGDTTLDTHKRSTTTITTFNQEAGGGFGGQSGFALNLGSCSAGTNCPGDGGGASNGNVTNTDGGDSTRPSQSGSPQAGADGGDSPNGGAGADGGSLAGASVTADDGGAPGGGGAGGAAIGGERNGGDGADGKVLIRAYG